MERRKALTILTTTLAGLGLTGIGVKLFKHYSYPNTEGLDSSLNLIKALCDVIIPKTDSPSASECSVQNFVLMQVKTLDAKTLNNFISGLEEVEGLSTSQFSKSFVECTDSQREQIFQQMKNGGGNSFFAKAKRKIYGKSFYDTIRELTVIGYFTSEVGATQALRYELVPSRYSGCVSYLPHEKAWATF